MSSENKSPQKMEEVSSIEFLIERPRRTALDFPPSPTDGDIHRSYVYDATKSMWVATRVGGTSV